MYDTLDNNSTSILGVQTWTEIVSYDITIINPCVTTELVVLNTTVTDMEYAVGENAVVQSFVPVSDTVTGNITTSGSCGNIIYTLSNLEGSVGTEFIEVVDLVNAKGIRVFIEDEEFIGYWNITMRVRMEDYNLEYSFDFAVNITSAEEAVPLVV